MLSSKIRTVGPAVNTINASVLENSKRSTTGSMTVELLPPVRGEGPSNEALEMNALRGILDQDGPPDPI